MSEKPTVSTELQSMMRSWGDPSLLLDNRYKTVPGKDWVQMMKDAQINLQDIRRQVMRHPHAAEFALSERFPTEETYQRPGHMGEYINSLTKSGKLLSFLEIAGHALCRAHLEAGVETVTVSVNAMAATMKEMKWYEDGTAKALFDTAAKAAQAEYMPRPEVHLKMADAGIQTVANMVHALYEMEDKTAFETYKRHAAGYNADSDDFKTPVVFPSMKGDVDDPGGGVVADRAAQREMERHEKTVLPKEYAHHPNEGIGQWVADNYDNAVAQLRPQLDGDRSVFHGFLFSADIVGHEKLGTLMVEGVAENGANVADVVFRVQKDGRTYWGRISKDSLDYPSFNEDTLQVHEGEVPPDEWFTTIGDLNEPLNLPFITNYRAALGFVIPEEK